MAATRDDLLKHKERKYKTIVHEETGEIRIRSLTERDRSEIKCEMGKRSESGKYADKLLAMADELAWVVCYALVDDDDNRLFSNADIESVKDIDGGLIQAIYDVVEKWCEVSFVNESQRIEDAAKNSVEIGGGALPSDSRISLAG